MNSVPPRQKKWRGKQAMSFNPFLKRLEEQASPQQQQMPQQEPQQQSPFIERLESQPSTFENVTNKAKGIGIDVASVLGGLPGDFRDFLGSAYGFLEEKTPEKVGNVLKKGRELFEESGVKKLLPINYFPTSHEVEEKLHEKTGQKYRPQSKQEEELRGLGKDITSFFAPGSGKMKLLSRIGIPVMGFLTKKGLEKAGGTHGQQEAGKMGTMIALSMMNPGGAKKHASSLFGKSERLVPPGTLMDASKVESALTPLKSKLAKGGSAPSKTEALKKIDEIEGKIKNGHMEIHDALEFRKNINEILERAGGFDVPEKERIASIRNLESVKDSIIKGINEYGKTHPEFGKINHAANRAFAVVQNSNLITRNIEKALQRPLKSSALKSLLNIAPYAGAGATAILSPELAAVGVGATGLYNSVKILTRVVRSPEMLKYYTNLVTAGLQNNAAEIARNAKLLDEAFMKDEESKATPPPPPR